MAHSHAEDRTTYYTEQLCTIGICGLLGGVAVMLYYQNLLYIILATWLHVYILYTGILLLLLVALRAIGLWRSVAKSAVNHDHGHGHAHGHDHDHDHGHEQGHTHTHDEGEHSHEHVHTCDHEHEHGLEHTHDCGHEHTWNPGRYIVLLLPIVLYFLHLPNAGFSASRSAISVDEVDPRSSGKYVENTGLQITKDSKGDLIQVVSVVANSPAAKAGIKAGDLITQITREKDDAGKKLDKPEVVPLKGVSVEDAVAKLRGKPESTITLTIEHPEEAKPKELELTRAPDVIRLNFTELQSAAYTASSRRYYEGKVVKIVGQYSPSGNDRMFTLVRIKIKCCAADVVRLNVVIQLDPQVPGSFDRIQANDWVNVTGRITFGRRKDRDEYVTMLIVSSPEDVKPTDPDPQYYLQ